MITTDKKNISDIIFTRNVKDIFSSDLFINLSFLLILSLLTVLLYAPSMNGPFIFDDKTSIEYSSNLHLKSLDFQNIKKLFNSISPQRAIPKLSFALNYYFNGFKPFGYHLVNIAIHILTAFILFLFIKLTISRANSPRNDRAILLISAASAIIWAAHPLQSQSVSYIVQRMNSMAALFFLLSIFFYAKARLCHGKYAIIFFIISFISAAMAILSKENAASLPFFILLYEWYFFQDLSFSFFKKKIFIISSAATITAAIIIFIKMNIAAKILSFYSFQPFTLKQRLLTELRVVCFYISQLFYPHPTRLSLEHDFPLSYSFTAPGTTIAAALIIAAMFFLAAFLAKRFRLISFSILWFLGNLVIESSVIGLALVYEHRMYLPSMFLIVTSIYLISKIQKCTLTKFFAFLICLFFLSNWTYQRNIVWGDEYLFGRDAVGKNPENNRVHYNFAKTLESMKRFDEAIIEYNETLRISPGNAYAHNNLGAIYQDRGQIDKAIYHFKRAVKLKPQNQIARRNLNFLMIYQERLSKQKK